MDRRDLKGVDAVAFNQAAERAFVDLVRKMLVESGGVCAAVDIRQEACFLLDVSDETAKRYLFKYTARSAPFMVDRGQVSARAVISPAGKKKRGASEQP